MPDTLEPLGAEDAAALAEFARACKAAARAVQLYPSGHPAIAATLARLVHLTSADVMRAPLKLTVREDGLLVGDRAPARPDPAVSELALLFHHHQVGQAIVRPGGGVDAWHSFLLLLGRSPEAVRAEGGIARLWGATPHRHVQLREIDYSEVLRERADGEAVVWNDVLAHCLRGEALTIDEAGLRQLLEIATDSARLSELVAAVEKGGDDGAPIGGGPAVARLLRAIVDAVSATDPSKLEQVLRGMAAAFANLSPDTLLALLQPDGAAPEAQLVDAVVNRMSDASLAQFVARGVVSEGSATERLALAFQALVPDRDHQQRLLALAHDDVAASPLGQTDKFEAAWDQVAEQMLTSYSDEPFVPRAYARELSAAQTQATAVEQTTDDPPDRIKAWLDTIATTELRALDLSLVLDLLRLEANPGRWGGLMTPVVRLLEDLLLVGDFDAARELLAVIVREASTTGAPRSAHAAAAIDLLVSGSAVRHVTTHLATADETQFETIKSLCVPLGEVLVKPLAEALAAEDRPLTRERVTAILLAFGSVGRRTLERLKHSDNPAIRRTAVYLIREFGGSDTLPDLTELLDDTEPQVHRAAIRAILNIGTDEAFRVLERALSTGSPHARDAIMKAFGMVRDERAAPMLIHILQHARHTGDFTPIYVRAIETLGTLRDPSAVDPLRQVLYRGEWWAPRRTAAIRAAAAGALARIATPDAAEVLRKAATRGSRGVRAAARPHAATAQHRSAGRSEERS